MVVVAWVAALRRTVGAGAVTARRWWRAVALRGRRTIGGRRLLGVATVLVALVVIVSGHGDGRGIKNPSSVREAAKG